MSPGNYKDRVAYLEMVADDREGRNTACSYEHLREYGWTSEDIALLRKIEWSRNIEKNNSLIKRLKDNTMCTSRTQYEKTLDAELSALGKPVGLEIGSKWVCKGDVLTVKQTGLRYFNNPDSNPTMYAIVEDADGQQLLMTHAAIRRDCKPWAEKPTLFVTLGGILNADPCREGLLQLCRMYGCGQLVDTNSSTFQLMQLFVGHPSINKAVSVQEFYNLYHANNGYVSGAHLRFVCKMLNLVPRASNGPDRATMLRLLGIKE
jgi:hypothetical protein